MKHLIPAALAAFLWVVPCLADGVPDPAKDESFFDGARLADSLSGTLTDPTKDVRVRVYVSAGSKASATLTPDPVFGTQLHPTLVLCDDAGNAVDVAAFDKTKPGGAITWKNVPLAATGGYSFILRGTGAGDWALKLSGKLAKIVQSFPSPADLAVAAETHVDFNGLRGGSLSFQLSPTGSSKFAGQLVRVERPDGSTIDGTTTILAAKGKVLLDVDGVHRLVFKNVGRGIGPWLAKTTVTPPALVVRRGYVSPAGTALVPVVTKVTPSSDYHKDDVSEVTLTGRNFQTGADVRLVRKNFDDLVATNVQVVSETQVVCTLNLDTLLVTGKESTGTWHVGVWNAPTYLTPGDAASLVHDAPTQDQKKTFACVAATSIRLPPGAVKGTEVWQLAFTSDFQTDLNAMGLGSSSPTTETLARNAVEAYVVCFLRDLFQSNETTGALVKNVSPPVSFLVGKMPSAAGKPGVTYNRIEIGGAWQTGDPTDPAEPLLWGFVPRDPLNSHLDDLPASVDDGSGGTTRVGYGVRTRILDPGAGTANPDWTAAMQPLLAIPLTAYDQPYFSPRYVPSSSADALRYRDIVNQVTRASREIAGIVAHQIGRAMGLAPNGSGPMANPSTAGYLWPTTTGLFFNTTDLSTLQTRAIAVPPPGKSVPLVVGYFPFLSTQAVGLPDDTAFVPYAVAWNYVGGRANAVPTDYLVQVTDGSQSGTVDLSGLVLSYSGLAGKTPLWFNQTQNQFNCGISYFRITVTDKVRHNSVDFFYRLRLFANVAMLPTALQQSATTCNNTLLSQP